MTSWIWKFITIPIYLIYAYLLGWQVFYANQQMFFSPDIRKSYRAAFEYMPAIVLILYGLLVCAHIVVNQKRLLIFSSFFAAATLSVFNTNFSVAMAVLLAAFALLAAFLELKERPLQPQREP